MMKIEGTESESGSISQRHGSTDPDPDPDPHQNVMDPQYWKKRLETFTSLVQITACYIPLLLLRWAGRMSLRVLI
jgi:hypothetical protein